MTKQLRIALDAMGADQGPAIAVAALKRALSSFPTVEFLLVGDQNELAPFLKTAGLDQETPNLTLVQASQTVLMTDKPSVAVRSKPDSSIRVGLNLIQDGAADALVSAGNTGALMASSYLTLKPIPGVIRPALVAPLPQRQGKSAYLLDLGANPSCDAETLYQFGIMGSVMAQQVNGIAKPRVALLNMGVEDMKGNDLVRHAGNLLASSPYVNYVGFIEGSALFAGEADVIVCDGFTGNIALKSCEGLADLLHRNILDSLSSHLVSRWLAKLLFKRFKRSWNWLNPDQYNGASLLGLRGVVMKSHGNASANAYFSAIGHAIREVQVALPGQIHDRIEAVLLEQQ